MKPNFSRQQDRQRPRSFILFHALGGVVFIAALLGLTLRDPQGAASVQAFVTPNIMTVRMPATIDVSFVLYSEGMFSGGGFKIRLPKGFERPQADDPELPNYVAVRTSNPSARMRIANIDRADVQVPWPVDNNAWVLTALLEEFALQRGDTIHVVFGAHANGGRANAPSRNYSDTVLVACDLKGEGSYQVLAPSPTITILARPPYRLVAFLPSTMKPGQRAELKLVVTDEYHNLALPFEGTIEIASTDASASFPAQAEFTAEDSSRKVIEVAFNTPGVQYMQLRALQRSPDSLWQVYANPVEVVTDTLPYRVFWGDLHSHSRFSYDGYGSDPFIRARDLAGLDFYALTEHTSFFAQRNAGLTAAEWEAVKRSVVRFHAPGKFVTIPAYEFSAKAPSGHHNVYFNAHDQIVPYIPLFRNEDYYQIQKVWEVQREVLPPGVEMITVPHHTGIIWNEFIEGASPQVSFGLGFSNFKLRPQIEIYSGHGLSESYDPQHRLSYKSLNGPGVKGLADGPHYAQDAWAAGERLGVIASSDDHSSRPGLPYYGLAAIYAKELTREAIFDALKQRRTYGTTGQRILLHFEIDGHLMGASIVQKTPHYPHINVAVHGTDELDFVEVLCWNKRQRQFANGHPLFATLYRENGNGKHASFQVVDSSYTGSSIYYVRVKQKKDLSAPRQFIGREVWAWSSPIWMEETPSLDTSDTKAVPRSLELSPNYPNPFRRATIMRYYLPQPGRVQASLYNTLGQLVEVLVDDVRREGWHGFRIANRDLSPGIYFVRLEAAGQIATQKIVMVK
ncbi:MAG: DUF3604 domain-containing protein [bacterium]